MPSAGKGRSLSADYCLLSADKGITLAELLVGIAIVMILIVALGFDYSGWQGKYKVESEVKQLYSDLVSARVRAMQRSVSCFVDFPSAAQYELTDDTNGDDLPDSGDTLVASSSKTVNYPLNWSNADGIPFAKAVLSFDKKGLISYCDTRPVAPNPPICTDASPNQVTINIVTTTNMNPDYNCVLVSQTIINMGQMVCSITTSKACYQDADCPSGETCSLCQGR
jgi:type II secretory pathway pseudopilin PulG